ncbi:RdgB/HAM1 family non-canonical purine NTP pyrophosphatase [Agromyces archimandritae]|uniref:dITP/XTP pyrophosphatase n=1 Tax=Agromyces archimandritae TaxID=2781962 RepID=A0A975IN89_9MICO|nr:RdgB/HAM1 family non-canonical purine NTP pyrophosphatase [Agromyces archimandritae]QTX04310.1 RdgB/HAM1 family non-canonical purine NTP pyrophosphatase [Agromyces archimandritae]
MPQELVLATHNAHKVAEFQRIVGERMPGAVVLAYDGPEPVEDGTSFAANALIKARAAAAHTGRIALADDSGITVDILGAAPGILSARWSGTRDDRANRELLLAQLADIRDEDRGARFTCAIAVVAPDGREEVAEGVWPGRIARAAAGEHGFGYDPVFVPDGGELTAAELAPEAKDADSHRARALALAVPVIERLAAG